MHSCSNEQLAKSHQFLGHCRHLFGRDLLAYGTRVAKNGVYC